MKTNITTFTPNPELDAMIDKYALEVVGNKVGTSCRPNKSEIPALMEFLTANKDELKTYIPARKAWEKAEMERKTNNFEAIPGVSELRAARQKFRSSRARFNAAMDRGESVFGPLDNGSSADELARQYPDAVFALYIRDRRFSSNHELARIAQRAYDRLCEGEDPKAVKADYEADEAANAEKHQWD